jgi:hypothetical protein
MQVNTIYKHRVLRCLLKPPTACRSDSTLNFVGLMCRSELMILTPLTYARGHSRSKRVMNIDRRIVSRKTAAVFRGINSSRVVIIILVVWQPSFSTAGYRPLPISSTCVLNALHPVAFYPFYIVNRAVGLSISTYLILFESPCYESSGPTVCRSFRLCDLPISI